jgi:hypothetical protein
VPPETKPGTDFLLNGDEAVDSAFASELVALAVAGQVEDLCENILLKEGGMCNIPTGCCSPIDGDGPVDKGIGTALGLI